MSNVSYVRPELKVKLSIYNLILDCIDGEKKVKSKKTAYLPKPNAADLSEENDARYDAYLRRAVFYNVSSRTLRGLVGQIFDKDPTIELPDSLEPINEDANGNGLTLTQSAQKACSYVGALGRAGLLSDYPVTQGFVTKADLAKGDIRPTMTLYEARQMINWRTRPRGAKEVLSLVVIVEKYISKDDGFEIELSTQHRVLRLGISEQNNLPGIVDDEDVYTVEIWRETENGNTIHESYQPQDSKGSFLSEIPFTFIGSENNDSEIDIPPMYDISSLNIAHYRNSADYEESSFIVGQPTPYFAGLTQDWVKDNFQDGVVQLGSRAAIPLPEGGSAGLLQAESNIMPFEAMQHKERQMVALGAKLVEQTSVQRTATEAAIESSNENSVLNSISKNVSAAYQFGLEQCALFTGDNPESIVFELNSDFDFKNMSLEDIMKIIAAWQQNAISFTEMRMALHRADVAIQDEGDVIVEIEAEIDKKMEREKEQSNNLNQD